MYLSLYFRRRRSEYYDRLAAVQERGDWEGWIRFFLRGVAETADQAATTAEAIAALRETERERLTAVGLTGTAVRLLDLHFRRPLLTAPAAADALGVSRPTTRQLLERLQYLGIVQETTGGRRNRRFRHTPYLDLFETAGTAGTM